MTATQAPPVDMNGWRDPNYTPPPDATPVPACWRATPAPSSGGATPTPAAVASPGTVDSPRAIGRDLDCLPAIDDANGAPLAQIAVVPGETVKFDITNSAGFGHNFYIGMAEQLSTNATTGLPGVPEFLPAAHRASSGLSADDLTGLEYRVHGARPLPDDARQFRRRQWWRAGSPTPSGSPVPSGSAAPSATPAQSAPTPSPGPSATP